MKTIIYTLDNVEQRLGAELPTRSVRENLAPGSIVKLIFSGPDPLQVERMWVIVTGRLPDGRYCGELDNEPIVIELPCGYPLTFGPEHVLAIHGYDVDPRPRLRLAA